MKNTMIYNTSKVIHEKAAHKDGFCYSSNEGGSFG